MGQYCNTPNCDDKYSVSLASTLAKKLTLRKSHTNRIKEDLTLNKQQSEKFESLKNHLMISEEEDLFELKERNEDENINMFIELLFLEINEVRRNPASYIEILKSNKRNIREMCQLKIFKEKCGNKIKLLRGEDAFDDCISILEKTKPLKPLVFDNDLIIKIPQHKSLFLDKKVMVELINEKKNSQKFYSKYFGFHYDIGSINPETSCVLQLVDDRCKKCYRRNNILNEEFNFIGISVEKIPFQNNYIVYISFSS